MGKFCGVAWWNRFRSLSLFVLSASDFCSSTTCKREAWKTSTEALLKCGEKNRLKSQWLFIDSAFSWSTLEKDFHSGKTFLMHSKLLRKCKVGQKIWTTSNDNFRKCFSGGKGIFLHCLNNEKHVRSEENFLMQPQNAFQIFTKLRRENFPWFSTWRQDKLFKFPWHFQVEQDQRWQEDWRGGMMRRGEWLGVHLKVRDNNWIY